MRSAAFPIPHDTSTNYINHKIIIICDHLKYTASSANKLLHVPVLIRDTLPAEYVLGTMLHTHTYTYMYTYTNKTVQTAQS